MEATTDLFINIIQNHQIIYDTASKDFKNVNKKEDEWEKIAKESRMSVDAAKRRYFSLRQKYSREKKKETICARTKQTFRPWVFFERLSFLGDFIKPRRTYTNDVDGIDGDDFINGDNSNGETTKLIHDNNNHQSSVKRHRLNDLSDDEYNHAIFFGEPMSLAEEEAIMAEGLNFENTRGDLSDFEVLAEIELEQQQVPALPNDDPSDSQKQPLDIHARTSSMLGPLDIDARTSSMLGPLDIDARTSRMLSPQSETLLDRATLSIDEQLSYVEMPTHNANVERSSSCSTYVRSTDSNHSSATSTQNMEFSSQAGTYRLIGSTQPQAPKTTIYRNDPAANRKLPNSTLPKNSPVVQQQQVSALPNNDPSDGQEQTIDIHARTSSMLGPLDIDVRTSSMLSPRRATLLDRATLSIDEQLNYIEIPSSKDGICPLGSETFRVPSSTATHNAYVERGSSSSMYVRSTDPTPITALLGPENMERSSQAGTSNTRYRLIGSTQPQAPKTATNRNDTTANRKLPNSTLSKNSPVVQATVSVRQQDSNRLPDKDSSMEKIKEKMELYLNACNDKLVKKTERSPHASFLTYLGSKMDDIPKEKIPALEKEILETVYRFSFEG